jgi:hypothetical protein
MNLLKGKNCEQSPPSSVEMSVNYNISIDIYPENRPGENE